MSAFLDILDLLSSPPGALIYYLILLFSIWAIVGLALSRWSRGERGGLSARLLLAGALMSFSRFLLIIVALLNRQDGTSLLRFGPPLERFVDASSVLILCWAFVLPQRNRTLGQLAVGIAGLLTLALYAITSTQWMHIWSTQSAALYNRSWQNWVWELWQLVFLIPAFVYTLVDPSRERDALNIGLGVLVAGHLLQLVYPLADRIDHLSAWTRFANLVAFPVLSVATYQLIVQRFDVQTLDLEAITQKSLSQMASLMSVLDTSLKVSASLDTDSILRDGLQAIARLLQSDLCALALVVPKAGKDRPADTASPEDRDAPLLPPEEMELTLLYDDNRLVTAGQRVRIDEYPMIRQALAQMTPLILEAGEQASSHWSQAGRDSGRIYRLLGHDQDGPLLIQPLEHTSQAIGAALVCRAHDKTPFAPGEARKSETLAAYLGTAIGNARRYQETEARLRQLAAELEAKETVHTRMRTDLENRLARSEEQATLYMQRLYEAELGEQQAQEDARQARRKLSLLRQESQTEVARARNELKHSIQQAARLTQQIANLDAQCLELGSLVQVLEQEKDLLQLRLKVAATERSDLDTDLTASLPAQALLSPEHGNRAANKRLSDGVLTQLTRDLRAPMASALEYAERFANSAAGRLSSQQRELLRHVQVNIERMQGTLNNLMSLEGMHEDAPTLRLAHVDVTKMIEVALARARFRLEEKELKTRLAIGVLPTPSVDPNCMQQILDNLVSHACRSAGSETTIGIRAYAEDSNGGARQLHIAISYTGPEPPDKASGPRILDPATSSQVQHADRTRESERQGGKTEFEVTERLVEAHQGRTWHEVKPGVGETSHLIIPVEPTQPSAPQGNGRD